MSTTRLSELCRNYYASSTNKISSTEFIEWLMCVVCGIISPMTQEINAKFSIADIWCTHQTLIGKIRTEFNHILNSSDSDSTKLEVPNPI